VALGVQQVRGAALDRALAPQRLLLVLDNCEQVAPQSRSCARSYWRPDDLHILATSREQLWVEGVEGEVRHRLPPLSLPESSEPGEARQSASVALFTERDRRADPRFTLTTAAAHV
jgi:predicted ATPase